MVITADFLLRMSHDDAFQVNHVNSNLKTKHTLTNQAPMCRQTVTLCVHAAALKIMLS